MVAPLPAGTAVAMSCGMPSSPNNRRETALLRLAQSAGLLFFISVPIVATALNKALGLPALLNWWGAGFLGAWTIALVATLHYGVAAARLRPVRTGRWAVRP